MRVTRESLLRIAKETAQERVQFDGDRLVGANAVGFGDHVGAFRGLLEGRRRLGAWKRRLMDDPAQVMQAYVETAVPASRAG